MASERETFELAVLDQLGEGVIVADADGTILRVNRAAEDIHGRVRLDIPPDQYSQTYELLTLDDEPYPTGDLPLSQAVIHGLTVTDAPWKIRRPDGTIVIAVGTARPIRDEAGNQVGSVLTMRDETRRYLAEQQLKEALKAKDTLLYEVNHRVRNSLQVVASIISMHLRTVKDADAREALESAQRRIEVITATHRSLYELGTHDRVDCSYLLPDLCKQLVETYDVDRKIRLKCKKEGVLTLAVSQAVSLCLAVTELVTNACKYAFEGRETGLIELGLMVGDKEILVSVFDDGVGISDKGPARAKSGIGSLLVSTLAQGIGAKIDCESGPDGTRYSIRFEKQAEPLKDDYKEFGATPDEVELSPSK